MEPMILVPVLLVVLGVLIVMQRRQKQAAAGKQDIQSKKSHRPGVKTAGAAASPAKRAPAPSPVSFEKEEEIPVQEDWGWDTSSNEVLEGEVLAVAQEVDALTEYKVYKQFGYHEKAAESLIHYLHSEVDSITDGVRSTLVNELVQLWLDAKKPDSLGETLSEFSEMLTKTQLEDYIKQGLAIDKNNLNLRVLAEEKLGWSVQQTAAQIGEKSGLDANQSKSSRFIRRKEAEVRAEPAAAVVRPRKDLVTNPEQPNHLLVRDEEKTALMGFMKPELGYRLMKDRLAYDAAVGYANKAIRQADKPAALIIDALSLDYKNRNIEHFAQHLWRLYYTLGQYGRQVKERMLGWGLNLGDHEIFSQLEANPNEAQLRDIGIEHGFLERGTSINKAHRKALIQIRTDSVGVLQSPAEKALKDVESLLMYGQLDEAMTVLEDSIIQYPDESQLYITLFDICERAEEWERLEQVLHKIRANVQNPPEEVVLAMSQLLQKINYGSVRA